MNTKKLFQNTLYILVGTIMAIGLSYVVHAAAFVNPSGTPPANNTPTPLNVGTTDQIKQGGFAVTTFLANANAELDGNTYFGGVLHANPANTNSTINFGGTDPKGIVRKVALALSGGFNNTGAIASTPLSNGSMSTVCSDANGTVILCAATDVCSNITGTQSTVPAGYTANTDGTCSIAGKRFLSIRSSSTYQDAPVTYSKFVGNIINGNFIDHTAGSKSNNGAAPLVDTVGIDNNFPYGWVIDEIQGMKPTALDNSNTRLMNVVEKGSYTFKISLAGKVGSKGKFSSDHNNFGTDFYMKIHRIADGSDQYVHLDSQTVTSPAPSNVTPPVATLAHEPYPVTNKNFMDYGFLSTGSGTLFEIGGLNGAGDQFSYVPYATTFQQVLVLNPGDTVDLYGLMYGLSSRAADFFSGAFNIFTGNGDFNNFTDYIDITDSTIDIVEIPQ